MAFPLIGPIVSGIVGGLIRFFSNGGAGHKIGTAVTDGGALIAIGAPLALWLLAHKDDAAITMTFTYGELLFLGAIAFVVIKIAHYTRPGTQADRSDFRS